VQVVWGIISHFNKTTSAQGSFHSLVTSGQPVSFSPTSRLFPAQHTHTHPHTQRSDRLRVSHKACLFIYLLSVSLSHTRHFYQQGATRLPRFFRSLFLCIFSSCSQFLYLSPSTLTLPSFPEYIKYANLRVLWQHIVCHMVSCCCIC